MMVRSAHATGGAAVAPPASLDSPEALLGACQTLSGPARPSRARAGWLLT